VIESDLRTGYLRDPHRPAIAVPVLEAVSLLALVVSRDPIPVLEDEGHRPLSRLPSDGPIELLDRVGHEIGEINAEALPDPRDGLEGLRREEAINIRFADYARGRGPDPIVTDPRRRIDLELAGIDQEPGPGGKARAGDVGDEEEPDAEGLEALAIPCEELPEPKLRESIVTSDNRYQAFVLARI
jgi:hypothetical protein